MQDNNEGGVDIIRQAFEKRLQRVNASGGRPDANRRKPLLGRFLTRSSLVFFPTRSSLVFGRTDPIIIAHLGSEGLRGGTRVHGYALHHRIDTRSAKRR